MGRHADRLLSPSIVVRGCFTIALAALGRRRAVGDCDRLLARGSTASSKGGTPRPEDALRSRARQQGRRCVHRGLRTRRRAVRDRIQRSSTASAPTSATAAASRACLGRIWPARASGRATRRSARPDRTRCRATPATSSCSTTDPAQRSATSIAIPQHSGNLKQFIQRNTPHVFALGAIAAARRRDDRANCSRRDTVDPTQACSWVSRRLPLMAKGISFGSIRATAPIGGSPVPRELRHVASCRRVRAISSSGRSSGRAAVATIREFNRDAAHDEIGMQAGGDRGRRRGRRRRRRCRTS